jgi:hypothetical protein
MYAVLAADVGPLFEERGIKGNQRACIMEGF